MKGTLGSVTTFLTVPFSKVTEWNKILNLGSSGCWQLPWYDALSRASPFCSSRTDLTLFISHQKENQSHEMSMAFIPPTTALISVSFRGVKVGYFP